MSTLSLIGHLLSLQPAVPLSERIHPRAGTIEHHNLFPSMLSERPPDDSGFNNNGDLLGSAISVTLSRNILFFIGPLNLSGQFEVKMLACVTALSDSSVAVCIFVFSLLAG